MKAKLSPQRSGPCRGALAALALSLTGLIASAQTPPLLLDPTAMLVHTNFAWGINGESKRGVPLSNLHANGSDGRLTNAPGVVPTGGQFQGALTFGAIATGKTNAALTAYPTLSPSQAFAKNVANLNWPRSLAANGTVGFILRSAQVGAPYVGQQPNLFFGQVVSVPSTDEKGNLLTANPAPQQYWFAQPFTNANFTQGYFYWSSNASQVFATQPGQISITWRKAAPLTNTPPAATGAISYTNINGNNYLLYTVNYLVADQAVKPPQKIYWTEAPFTGPVVNVPAGQVSAVNVVYNDQVPRTVSTPYQDPYQTPVANPTNMLQEFRTLWFQSTSGAGAIHAYNVQGRVFVELLGEPNADGRSRRFLGFEIVDIYQQAVPTDITVNLGDRVPAYADATLDDSGLYPSAVGSVANINPSSYPFYHQQTTVNNGPATLYATRETQNLNDFLAYWLIPGTAGLQWPFLFDRYHEVWPSDPAAYSHYLRPSVQTAAQAQLTAVQLPAAEAPTIAWQDPLDQPRALLTPTETFYTFLQPPYYAHRTLIQYQLGNQVAYERVFSWLDTALLYPSNCVGTVAANLTGWSATNLGFSFANLFTVPLVVSNVVNVGDRILPPAGELGAAGGGDYWAGYILQTNGNSFNPLAYVDPFAAGFAQANKGAIIPVNAIPGKNLLEVWWFRQNNAPVTQGFQYVYWPSVIGRYTLQWPAAAPEIILAGNAGSGPLDSLQAQATIYAQNDPSQAGYNPNEEHALMLGGRAYALRDDLNLTSNTNGEYSSAPFVLLNYTGADGLPSMSAFHVRREKPEAGILFDYIVPAGSILQAPMPLPLLAPPLEGSGPMATNYNTAPAATAGDLPVGWAAANNSGVYSNYAGFTFQDRNHNYWVYRGPHAGLPALAAGAYNSASGGFGPLPPAVAVVNQPFTYYIHTSRQIDSLALSCLSSNLPAGLALQTTTNGLCLRGTPLSAGSNYLSLIVQDTADSSQVTNTLALTIRANGSISTLGPLALTSTNQYSATMVTYTNRAPFLAQPPTITNSFTMRFYYKTMSGFAWPGLANPPAVGSIVPYLLRTNAQRGGFAGDPTSKQTASLDIVYRPTWPELVNGQPVPTLYAGQTLTLPAGGLAGVRGQSSAQVLYQQSVAANITLAEPSVTLFDPTVQKKSYLAAGLPASVATSAYAARDYFPNLPPNLAQRLWFDPNTTNLVFAGQFAESGTGAPYLFLNVLRGADLAAVEGLCASSDAQYAAWVQAVTNLSTPVFTFYLNPTNNPNYLANPALTATNHAGDLVAVNSSDTPVDSYALSANGPGFGFISYIVGNGLNPVQAGNPVTVYVARVAPPLAAGELKIVLDANPLSQLITFQHSLDLAGDTQDYQYDWRIMPPVNGQPPTQDPANWVILAQGNDLAHYTLGGTAGIQALSDNYVTVRYRCTNPNANPATTNWSAWTAPALAEGWIKRVLAGVNPFNQRTTDLFNNPVNTTASIIAQAGHRWEGDVALNQDTLNDFGLIEVYETVLHKGEGLSINAPAPINYGPANDALLLAAGYLNDLYMYVANDAWADSQNPTIPIGTSDPTYGNVATALFAFKGEVASLLEQELGLLRGRDDFLAPGVKLQPAYNRLYWNYTRGIADGEVIYALKYDITDQNNDGVVNAADAEFMYPMGHGDAYGHYLTALKNYYDLLMNRSFTWVPQAEAVTILGAAVTVNYEHERKFAAAAGALARAGRQILDLTWRQYYQPGTAAGWDAFGTNQVNAQRPYLAAGVTNYVTRYWGIDHWATRVGQGSYLNWVVGNALVPAKDANPNDQGVQIVDRTTIPELTELPATATQLQTDMDNAEAGFTPLGLPQDALAFDINPLEVTGANPKTHFEQVYERAVGTLNNAVVAFNDARNVTQTLRSQQDSLTDFQTGVAAQELAYTNQLIEVYGTAYPDDMGPGQTYPQNYNGPDFIHYAYVDNPDTNTYNGILADPTTNVTFQIDLQNLPNDWMTNQFPWMSFLTNIVRASNTNQYQPNAQYFSFNIGPNGFFSKPPGWTSERGSPGSVQQAISALIAAKNNLRNELNNAVGDKQTLDLVVEAFVAQTNALWASVQDAAKIDGWTRQINDLNNTIGQVQMNLGNVQAAGADFLSYYGISIPDQAIVGLAVGGDFGKGLVAAIGAGSMLATFIAMAVDAGIYDSASNDINTYGNNISSATFDSTLKQYNASLYSSVQALYSQLGVVQGHLSNLNALLRALDDAQRAYQAQVAKGNRIQQERLTFRQHAAAVIQGYRTRDAAFRLFQNEKLERYNTLFNLAAQYAFLAANAYDYETGLLNTDAGRAFINRLVSAQALGVVLNGQPQYAGSDTGDPGLSSSLAEMKADWDVLKGRLGFNNPDGYGTVASLRSENYRILPSSDGDSAWQNLLQHSVVPDLLADSDVTRHCMQINNGSGLPVPGIVLTFSTTIADGLNLFGQALAAGDHTYSDTSFATQIFSVGVGFDGYLGMDNPDHSPSGSSSDPNALAANPFIYLIPVGVDSMRVPPLGDRGGVRTWTVNDVAVPLPFNISASDYSSTPFWQSSASLSEPLFAIRKDQAFRPVASVSAFSPSIYGAAGALQPSEFTNKRLIGRSVWNSKWKLVIPGRALLNDPRQGLQRFINTVKDVKLYFITYSYSGN